MALIEEKTLAAVAATAAALSPQVRKVARKGAVYGLAGVLRAGDVVVAAARGAAHAARSTISTESEGAEFAPATKRATPAAKRSSARSGEARNPRSGQTRGASARSGSRSRSDPGDS
jgi:hypothetical protein